MRCTPPGATVFMSSHVLHEVEEVAHRVAIIREDPFFDFYRAGYSPAEDGS